MDERTPAGTGLQAEDERRPGQEWRAVLLRGLVAVLVLGGVYVGGALYFQDRPPAGLSVAGVEIGSLTHDEVLSHLQRQLADEAAEPVVVTVRTDGDQDTETEITLDPAEAGLSYDLERSIDGVTGFSLDPRVLWAHVARTERQLPLLGAVDSSALTTAVQAAAKDYDTEAVEGDVSLEDGKVEVVDAAEGRQLDVAATVETIAAAWPDQKKVEGTAITIGPVLTQAKIQQFTAEEVEPVLAAPLKVTAKRGSGDKAKTSVAQVQPREIAAMLSIDQDKDHSLSLKLDEKAMLARLRQDLGQLERGPVDATVRLVSGKVEVVPARTGASLDEPAIMESVRKAIRAEGKERNFTTKLKVLEPQIPTSVSKEWKFAKMGSFSSVFPTGRDNEARTHNLHTGIEHVNGTVVMPGEQFSLGAVLSPITEAEGYQQAPIIIEGRLVMGIGGGLSQVSTTVFNTAWFSGVQLDAHTPHSFYIPRYPAGREATIAIPGLDNLWTNDTSNPIVIRSWITGDQIFMEFLGQRQYQVETVEGPRTEVQEPDRIVDDSPSCVPQQPSPGFVISVSRTLSQDGVVAHRDDFTTRYVPEDEVVCTHPDAGY